MQLHFLLARTYKSMQLDDAKRILNKNGKKYTDEQVKAMVQLMSEFVKLDVKRFKESKK